MKKSIALLSSLFFLIACSNNQNLSKPGAKKENLALSGDKAVYNSIYQNISSQNLDAADDKYIKLKTDYENSQYLNSAADTLAVVHMQNSENILANFYLQEALQSNPSDDFAKFLLVKNQFLAAVKNQRDKNYMNKALKALETDKDLVTSQDDIIAANSMLNRVKLDMAYSNKEISNLYKSQNKQKAYEIYQDKFKQLGVNVDDVYKP